MIPVFLDPCLWNAQSNLDQMLQNLVGQKHWQRSPHCRSIILWRKHFTFDVYRLLSGSSCACVRIVYMHMSTYVHFVLHICCYYIDSYVTIAIWISFLIEHEPADKSKASHHFPFRTRGYVWWLRTYAVEKKKHIYGFTMITIPENCLLPCVSSGSFTFLKKSRARFHFEYRPSRAEIGFIPKPPDSWWAQGSS